MEYYEKYNGNPGRGSHALSIEAAGLLSDAREKVKNFINAEKFEEVIFTKILPNQSTSLHIPMAWNL